MVELGVGVSSSCGVYVGVGVGVVVVDVVVGHHAITPPYQYAPSWHRAVSRSRCGLQ